MTNKLMLVTLLLLLLAVAVVLYVNYRQVAEPGREAVTSVSFICADDHNFVAEFNSNFDRLAVIVNGKEERSLPKVNEDSIRFADNEHAYQFAGEEVTVTDLQNGDQTTCHQPFDPNNAPYNFGDSGEGAGENQDSAAAVKTNLQGSWQSIDDPKFTREFKDDLVIDRYEDSPEATATSSLEVLTGAELTEAQTGFPIDLNKLYVRLIDQQDPSLVMYFTLAKLTPEELELVYMEGNGVLRFKSLQE